MHARSLTKKVIFHESFPAKVLKHNGVKLFMKLNLNLWYVQVIFSEIGILNQNVNTYCHLIYMPGHQIMTEISSIQHVYLFNLSHLGLLK